MKKIFCGLLCAVCLMTSANIAIFAEDNSAKVYVSQENGDDNNTGTDLNTALKTIEKAQEKARDYAKAGVKTDVILLGGIYHLDSALEFTSEDSGSSAETPITYRAIYGQNVKLTRGKKLTFVKSEAYSLPAAIPEAAREKIYEADVTDMTDLTNAINDVLYVGRKMQQPAQWPNSGYRWMNIQMNTNDNNESVPFVTIPDEKKGQWTGISNAYIGYWYNGYNYALQRGIEITDENIQLSGSITYGRSSIFLNALCELDAAGEYYIDTDARKVYLYAENAAELDNAYICPKGSSYPPKNIINIYGAKNIRFENIDLFCTSGRGFNITDSDNITIYGSEIKGIGSGISNPKNRVWEPGYAIYANNTTNLLVCACNISELGENGVYISGGKQVTLTPSNNVIRNTLIHDFAKIRKASSAGITLGGVGVKVSHCEIYNAPHQAICFSGNDHVIENNRIYNVLRDTSDSGAIYCGRSWTERGSVIKNNYIYNTRDVADYTVSDGNEYWGGTDKDAIYCDDLQSGITVSGNIVYNMARAYIFGGGSDNKLIDNVAISCRRGVEYDNAGANGFRKQHINPKGTAGKNIYKNLNELIENNEFDKTLWCEKYPEFADVLERKEIFDSEYKRISEAYSNTDEKTLSNALLPAFKSWGFVYDRVVHNNYYTGVRAEAYKANGFYSGEYTGVNKNTGPWNIKSPAFLGRFYNQRYKFDENVKTKYTDLMIGSVDGMAPGFGEHDNANIIMTNEEMGVEISDSYDITINADGLSEGISRSTAQMGIISDEYVPSYSDNEFSVNPGNKFKAYAVIYDESGKLVEVQGFENAYLYYGQTIDLDVAVPQNVNENWYMNVYLWSADEGMIPIAQKTSIFGS